MKIIVMGAGGVGGYIGARLALAGMDVAFVARGTHLQALQSGGLRLAGLEPAHLPAVRASEVPAELGEADLVLFCVKLYDTAAAARALQPVLGADTAVLTLQNGVDSADTLGEVFGADKMLAGAAYFPANITAPGEVTYLGKIASKPHVAFGEANGGASTRTAKVSAALRDAGLAVEVAADTRELIWEKFLLIAGTSAATTLCRLPLGPVRSDPDRRWLLRTAIEEAYAVAVASGVELAPDAVDAVVTALDGNPADGKSSQLVDLENGKRLELEGLSGAVVRRGQALGVATPVNRTVYAALKQYVEPAVRTQA